MYLYSVFVVAYSNPTKIIEPCNVFRLKAHCGHLLGSMKKTRSTFV